MSKPIVFALLTALCWGCYGPALAQARSALQSPFKPYVAIGVAYLIWAIGGGLLGMKGRGEPMQFTGSGVTWSFIAGTLGAWGAFTLTMAMVTGGVRIPHVVMSLVFPGAVLVSALVGMYQTRHEVRTPPGLFAGIAVVLVGAALIAYNTPQSHPKPTAKTAQRS